MRQCLLSFLFVIIFASNAHAYASIPAVSDSKDFQILIAETAFDNKSHHELIIIGLKNSLSVQEIKIYNDTGEEIKYELNRTKFPLKVNIGYADWSIGYETIGYNPTFQVILIDEKGVKHTFEFMLE